MLRQALKSDFKVGVTLYDANGNSFTIRNKYAAGVWECNSRCHFESEARFYQVDTDQCGEANMVQVGYLLCITKEYANGIDVEFQQKRFNSACHHANILWTKGKSRISVMLELDDIRNIDAVEDMLVEWFGDHHCFEVCERYERPEKKS